MGSALSTASCSPSSLLTAGDTERDDGVALPLWFGRRMRYDGMRGSGGGACCGAGDPGASSETEGEACGDGGTSSSPSSETLKRRTLREGRSGRPAVLLPRGHSSVRAASLWQSLCSTAPHLVHS